MEQSPAVAASAPETTAAPTPPLSAARQRWINNPELTGRTQEYPDDLCKIKGIGDVYKQRLYRAGIYTWKQIAESDVETLRRATSAYPSSNVEEWQTQAQNLMEKYGRTNAVYTGPPPDDMTKILGIGPVGAAVLYRAGICTYEQLASTSIADLQELFPVAVAGDQPDFKQWLSRGANLADTKYEDKS
jgi:predicted flap endonuclease-1-like 5' DNA nuclease